jgi:hypothetical protein
MYTFFRPRSLVLVIAVNFDGLIKQQRFLPYPRGRTQNMVPKGCGLKERKSKITALVIPQDVKSLNIFRVNLAQKITGAA